MDKSTNDFLASEYEQCWDYIRFHYEQRDRTQRFYFTFVLAAGGLVVALSRLQQKPVALDDLPPLILPLVVLGVLTLGQLIQLRRGTTLYHKTIVSIRRQLIGKAKTPLYTSDRNPRFFAKGFNFFAVLIVIVVTATLAAIAYVGLFAGKNAVPWAVVVGVVATLGQFWWYWSTLKAEDREYDDKLLFPERRHQDSGGSSAAVE